VHVGGALEAAIHHCSDLDTGQVIETTRVNHPEGDNIKKEKGT
jgi:hypothetical protein